MTGAKKAWSWAVSNPSWVNIGSAGWVNIQAAPTANAPFRSWDRRLRLTFAVALSVEVDWQVAVKPQHRERDVFLHLPGDAGLQHPNDSEFGRHVELVYPRPYRENDSQVGEGFGQPFGHY